MLVLGYLLLFEHFILIYTNEDNKNIVNFTIVIEYSDNKLIEI
jgi:hypothetical protein